MQEGQVVSCTAEYTEQKMLGKPAVLHKLLQICSCRQKRRPLPQASARYTRRHSGVIAQSLDGS
eukprot:2875448-Pleurochrysis_carterae.AAC.6